MEGFTVKEAVERVNSDGNIVIDLFNAERIMKE